GVSGTCRKNYDSSFFKVSDSATTDVGLSNFLHFNSRNKPRIHPFAFQGGLQCHTIDYGSQHTHIIPLNAFNSTTFIVHTTKNIYSSDLDGYFGSHSLD